MNVNQLKNQHQRLARVVGKVFRNAVAEGVRLLYPPHCAVCGKGVIDYDCLCEGCSAEMRRLLIPFWNPSLDAGRMPLEPLAYEAAADGGVQPSVPALCRRCSGLFWGVAPLPAECAECVSRPPAFECVVAAYRMDGAAREAVHRFKYGGRIYLQDMLAGWLLRCLGDVRLRDPPPDVLVPVPLHWWKKCARGFNQAELLVGALLRLLSKNGGRSGPAGPAGMDGGFSESAAMHYLRMDPVLKRMRHTGTQTRLGRGERRKNVRNAFGLRRGAADRIKGRHVVLVDDVFTTGATLDACARALKRGGAASVRALAVARG